MTDRARSSDDRSDRGRQRMAERTVRLATPRGDGHDVDDQASVVLSAGGQRLALPADDVWEVLPPGPFTPLPPVSGLLGARNVRGRVVPIADLAALIGAVSQLSPDERPTLVLTRGDDLIGLLIDSARLTTQVTPGTVSPPPTDHVEHSPLSGIASDGTFILSAHRILDHPDLVLTARQEQQGAP